MEYKYTFEKDTFCFLFVENQQKQNVQFKGNQKIQFKSLCLTTF